MTERNAEHARFAPSGADIYGPDGCPAAVQMQERMPPQEETDEAAEGTAAHWLLAQTLFKIRVPDEAVAPNGVPINDEMRQSIVEIMTDFDDTCKSQGAKDYWSFAIEERSGAPTLIDPDFWGTPDISLINRTTKRVYLWDFKYGHGFVDVYRNWQLVGYFACLVETHKITDPDDWTVVFTIAQPRCFVRDELGGTLRETVLPGSLAMAWVGELRDAVALARAPDPIARTGDHCRYCRAVTICQTNQMAGGAAIDYAYRAVPGEQTAASIGPEMAATRRAVKRLTDRLTALEAQALAMVEHGQDVPFHRLDWSKPRTIIDKARIPEVAAIAQMFGVPIQIGVALPSPAELIKQGVDASVISPYTFTPPGSKYLAPISERSAEKLLGRRATKGK